MMAYKPDNEELRRFFAGIVWEAVPREHQADAPCQVFRTKIYRPVDADTALLEHYQVIYRSLLYSKANHEADWGWHTFSGLKEQTGRERFDADDMILIPFFGSAPIYQKIDVYISILRQPLFSRRCPESQGARPKESDTMIPPSMTGAPRTIIESDEVRTAALELYTVALATLPPGEYAMETPDGQVMILSVDNGVVTVHCVEVE